MSKSYAGAAYNALMEEETKESVVVMLLETFDRHRAERDAASAMLAALRGLVGLVQLVRSRDDCPTEIKHALTANYRLDDALAALAQAEAAGIKES